MSCSICHRDHAEGTDHEDAVDQDINAILALLDDRFASCPISYVFDLVCIVLSSRADWRWVDETLASSPEDPQDWLDQAFAVFTVAMFGSTEHAESAEDQLLQQWLALDCLPKDNTKCEM